MGSKPKQEEFTPGPLGQMQKEISLDILNKYDRDLEGQLLGQLEQDQTEVLAGRANVDASQATSAIDRNLISRAASSGGPGSGAAIGTTNPGVVGTAIAGAQTKAISDAEIGRTKLIGSGVKTVQAGEDITRAGLSRAASIGTARSLNQTGQNYATKIADTEAKLNMAANAFVGYKLGLGQRQADYDLNKFKFERDNINTEYGTSTMLPVLNTNAEQDRLDGQALGGYKPFRQLEVLNLNSPPQYPFKRPEGLSVAAMRAFFRRK